MVLSGETMNEDSDGQRSGRSIFRACNNSRSAYIRTKPVRVRHTGSWDSGDCRAIVGEDEPAQGRRESRERSVEVNDYVNHT